MSALGSDLLEESNIIDQLLQFGHNRHGEGRLLRRIEQLPAVELDLAPHRRGTAPSRKVREAKDGLFSSDQPLAQSLVENRGLKNPFVRQMDLLATQLAERDGIGRDIKRRE